MKVSRKRKRQTVNLAAIIAMITAGFTFGTALLGYLSHRTTDGAAEVDMAALAAPDSDAITDPLGGATTMEPPEPSPFWPAAGSALAAGLGVALWKLAKRMKAEDDGPVVK